ncbi:MAG: PilZ domain-containing protein [Candidatus Contendobacter sp.]|jgi:type IV pilus assembly protein PilZ|nr:PilZ domain-containing protein [Candidatus Contendobacter sp.]
MAAPPRQGVISLAIKDKTMLHSSFMPFIKSGGIFIPTERSFELGDEVFLLLTLLEDPERFAITGKVVWINYRTTPGGRQVGVGIQFGGADSPRLQKKIEALLAGYTRLDQPTNTM